jgi:hypothetical protein
VKCRYTSAPPRTSTKSHQQRGRIDVYEGKESNPEEMTQLRIIQPREKTPTDAEIDAFRRSSPK